METADAPVGRRLRGTLGATLVEYAVILALFAVPAVGASAYLTTKARAATTTNADCISTRPPPVACQAPTITTSTTATTIATTTTTQPGSTSTTTPLPTGSVTWDTTFTSWDVNSTNVAKTRFTIKTGSNVPVAGVVVQVRYTDSASGRQSVVSCTTDAAGLCTPPTYQVPYTAPAAPPAGTVVTISIVNIDSSGASPAVSSVSPPNSYTLTKNP